MRSLSVSSGPVARSFLQQCQLTLESDLFPNCGLLSHAGKTGD